MDKTVAMAVQRIGGKRDPSVTLILVAAFISFVFSVALWFFVDKDTGIFVGIWVPSILSFGNLIRRRP